MHIYLAGPYQPFELEEMAFTVEDNVASATRIAAEVFDAGHVPITPHLLSHEPAQHTEADALDTSFWYEVTMDMARRCDAMLMLPYWEASVGATEEREYAERVGMPVYEYKSDGIPDVHPTEQRCPEQVVAFIETVMQMYRVHLDKNADYSPANILGPGEIGLATRLWDKITRLLNLYGFEVHIEKAGTMDVNALQRDPKNESLDDTYLDVAVYGIIGMLLRAQKWGK